MKNITKKELEKAIELLDGAVKAFSQPPNTGSYNSSGLCWYVANMLDDNNPFKYSTSADREYRRLICIILNIKSIRETKDYMFAGGITQIGIYGHFPDLKYERRNFCIKRKTELGLQLKDKEE